jgi:TusA-related sulfurtransferase
MEQALERMVAALVSRNGAALRQSLGVHAEMRALLPRRIAERSGPDEITEEILGWFDDAPVITALHVQVEPIGDAWHAAYRLSLGGMDVPRLVEQHAYCFEADGHIDRLWLICSGFRPVQPSASIDALGEGCATLTARIAAEMRRLEPGQVLSVLTDDPAAPEGIASWSRLTDHTVVATDGNRFYLRHKETP